MLVVQVRRGWGAAPHVAIAHAQATLPTFSLSGVVGAASATAVDGDVNDPAAPYTPNDTTGTAQPIPNPVSLGGYVNEPGTGPAGRSDSIGDLTDFYAVELGAGQVVTPL